MDAVGSLSVVDRRQLLKWISNSTKKELFLLYSFTRDSASAAKFHDKCDNKGPTFTVVYNTRKSVYGGYTSQSWQKNSAYKTDSSAFLYSLSLDNKRTGFKLPVKKSQNAIYCYHSYGPTFGNGYDLHTFKDELTAKQKIYTLNGSCNLGQSYDTLNKKAEDVTNEVMTVTNLEVYGIRGIGTHQWRKIQPPSLEVLGNLRNDVELFHPPNHIENANILLLGLRGAGKSSFVNNVDSVFKGRVSYRAITTSVDDSTTIKYKVNPFVTGPAGKMLRFRLCDTPGLEEIFGILTQDVSFILDGYIQDGYTFNPSLPISPEIVRDFERPPNLDSRIHCVCFVIDGTTVHDIPVAALTKIHEIQGIIRRKGVPLLILLTKMDKIVLGLENDMPLLFRSSDVKLLVDQVAETFGVQRNHVLPMKNYESEMEVSEEIDALTLYNVRKLLMAAEDFISAQPPLEDFAAVAGRGLSESVQ